MSVEFAKILLECNCVKLRPKDPFTYASGLVGPIYCDNRQILGHVAAREKIISGMVAISQKYEFDVVAAMATAGIAHGAWMAKDLALPLVYVRSKPKAHGKNNIIEGHFESGSTALMVEDLVNQGSSSLPAIEQLRQAGMAVAGMLCIVHYGFKHVDEAFAKASCPLDFLVSLDDLLTASRDMGSLTPEEVAEVQKWQQNPSGWGAEL